MKGIGLFRINKKALVFLVFLFVCAAVFAESYTISGYRFEIKGETQESTIRSLIVPGRVEKFDTEESLKQALEQKKQVLINTRLFYEEDIFYHYDKDPAGGGGYNVFVTFATTDAKNKLILPYPKYDSNTGLVMGFRYKDKNFMGLYKDFSLNFDATQYESSYKEGSFYLEMPVEAIKIKNVTLSGTFEGNLDLHDKYNNHIALDIKETGLKIAKTNLNLSGKVDFNYYYGDFRTLKYGISYGNLRIGKKGFYVSAYSNLLFDWRPDVRTDTHVNASFTLGAIPIGFTRWTNTSYIKFRPKNFSDFDEGLNRYQITNSTRLSFVEKLSKISFGNVVNHYKDYNINGDYLELTEDVSYRINSTYSVAGILKSKWSTKYNTTNIMPGYRLTVNSSLFKIPYTFTIGEYNDFNLTEQRFSPYLETTFRFKYDKINYRGNFRTGHQVNVNTKFEWHPWEKDSQNKTDYLFNVEAISFPIVLSWFNPSVRFKMLSSSKNTYWSDDSDLRLKRDDIQKLFRGIKTNNEYVQKAYNSSQMVSAINLSLLTTLFEFEDFGWTYLNLFWDAGILRGKDMDELNKRDYKVLSGAGFEIICIMNSHPGYPIRASVGFNTEKLYDKFIAKKDDVEMEYEVYIGIGYAY